LCIKIIYIEGLGHSGSTLLDILLGSSKKITATGELKNISKVFFTGKCTCGKKYINCEFWSSVNNILKHNYDKNIWEIKLESDHFKTFEEDNFIFFDAIRKYTNTQFILDSSKSRKRLFLLSKSKLFKIYVIRIIKDSRNHLYSMKKAGSRVGSSHRYKIIKDSLDWIKSNLMGEFINYVFIKKFIRIKYDNFCKEPKKYFNNISKFLNIDLKELQGDPLIINRVRHNVGGNPMRLEKEIAIHLDEKWRNGLDKKEIIINYLLSQWLNILYDKVA